MPGLTNLNLSAVTPEAPQCIPQPGQNAWKPIALLFIGLTLFFATDAFISAAFLDDAERRTESTNNRGDLVKDSAVAAASAKGKRRRRRTLALYTRAIAALLGAMIHNTGLWVLLDEVFLARRFAACSYGGEYSFDVPCGVRNLCFTIVGYLILLGSNSAAGNAGVDQSYDLTPTPVLHMAGERTRQAVSTMVARVRFQITGNARF